MDVEPIDTAIDAEAVYRRLRDSSTELDRATGKEGRRRSYRCDRAKLNPRRRGSISIWTHGRTQHASVSHGRIDGTVDGWKVLTMDDCFVRTVCRHRMLVREGEQEEEGC